MRMEPVAAVELTGSKKLPHRVPSGMMMVGKVNNRVVKSGLNLVITRML